MTRKTRSVRSEAPALYAVQPTTRPAAIDEDATIALAKQYLWARLKQPGTALTSPQALRDYVNLTLADRPHEVFCIAYLDNRHRVIAFDELFRGTIDGASVHPREVVKATLAHNAAAIVLVHNHPSGVPEPSRADEFITSRLKDALALIDVRVLDHLIVAGRETVSFAVRGLI
jgi:DNA repair protein RadC